MTLLNIALAADRALVAVDTLVYTWDGGIKCDSGGKPCETTKALALPHAQCVVAVRGSSSLLHYLWERSAWLPDTDTAISRLPEMLRAASASAPVDHRGRYPADEVYITGWSKHYGRMVCVSFDSSDGFATMTATLRHEASHSLSAAPAVPPEALGQFPFPETPDDMLRIARRQVKHHRDIDPHSPNGGGRLLVATITRDGMTFATAGDLGLPAQRQPSDNGYHPSPADLHIADGGHIEILWRAGSSGWQQVNVPGDSTHTYLTGMQHDDRVVVKARTVNSLGRAGPWVASDHSVDGPTAIGDVQVKPDVENSASAFSSSSLVFYRSDIAYTPLTTVGSIVSRGASVSVSLTVTGSVGIDDTTVQSASMILELWVNGVNTGVDMRNDAVAMTQKGTSVYTGAANSRGSFTLSADAVVKYSAGTTINVQARLKSAFVNSSGASVSLPSNPSPDAAKMYLLCRGSLSLTENKV